jgi:hypothetical protein
MRNAPDHRSILSFHIGLGINLFDGSQDWFNKVLREGGISLFDSVKRLPKKREVELGQREIRMGFELETGDESPKVRHFDFVGMRETPGI